MRWCQHKLRGMLRHVGLKNLALSAESLARGEQTFWLLKWHQAHLNAIEEDLGALSLLGNCLVTSHMRLFT
jgi:hypothetical protein